MTSKDFQPIHVGQVWSRRAGRRRVEVVATTDHVNDPIAFGDRVRLRNISTGRYSHVKASTLREFWKFEQGASTDEQ